MIFHVWMLGAMVTARRGQGLVEYMLILTLISLIAVSIMAAIGVEVQKPFQTVLDALP